MTTSEQEIRDYEFNIIEQYFDLSSDGLFCLLCKFYETDTRADAVRHWEQSHNFFKVVEIEENNV